MGNTGSTAGAKALERAAAAGDADGAREVCCIAEEIDETWRCSVSSSLTFLGIFPLQAVLSEQCRICMICRICFIWYSGVQSPIPNVLFRKVRSRS
jgi:hypothetical protein